ncbi:hypothetical protein CLOM_g20506 [Closterium sp. NIES-68]|nr:hypothetical protein CLOM_g20506 [Closterium sp. NIES-68]
MILAMTLEHYGDDGASLGSIPDALSNLTRLTLLSLSYNGMTGSIPSSLANLRQLNTLSLTTNELTGSIPSAFGQLQMLTSIDLSSNLLNGTIPASIATITSLSSLDIGINRLSGSIPTSLGSLVNLQYLLLNTNKLMGPLPPSLSNLSKLQMLVLNYNGLSGTIHDSLANLPQLSILVLANNSFSGAIPSSFHRLSNLDYVDLEGNQLSGSFPSAFASLTQLSYLSLKSNLFSGHLPSFIGNLSSLTLLDLGINQLSGSIPSSLWTLPALLHLDLSDNILSGSLPTSITGLDGLCTLDLSANSFTNSIPDALGSLTTLTSLDLSNTMVGSTMPSTLGGLTQLAYLGVQGSRLSGLLPATLGSITALTKLDFNGTGLACPPPGTSCVVPQTRPSAFCSACTSFCTSCTPPPPPSPSPPPSTPNASPPSSDSGLSTGAIVGIAVGAGLLLLALTAAAAYWFWRVRNQPVPHKQNSRAARLMRKYSKVPPMCQQYSLDDMEQATGNWAEGNLLGSGGFGDVYKGVSPDDGRTLWAVKRAKLLTNDFDREVSQMATKHHPNLVRLLGFCIDVHPQTAHVEQILIYEFVPNGDLEQRMAPDTPTPLTLQQRLDILVGAAHGFEYLHSFNMVHRDIKPANILLDTNLQPKIADFGLLRMGEGTTVNATRVMGTPGYVDPAYARTYKATTATDVYRCCFVQVLLCTGAALYSFGVLMLVVTTGREVTFYDRGKSVNVAQWVQEQIGRNETAALRDPRMEAPEDIVMQITQLAIRCTAKRTAHRPGMADVASELQSMLSAMGGGSSQVIRAAEKVDAQLDIANANAQDLDEAFSIIDGMKEPGNSGRSPDAV